MSNLPLDAALWRDIRENPETPQEKYGDNAVSIDEFVRKVEDEKRLKQTA